MVLAERAGQRYTMLLDAGWIDLAIQAEAVDPALVADAQLPVRPILAVVRDWPQDWSDSAAGDVEVEVDRPAEGPVRIALRERQHSTKR